MNKTCLNPKREVTSQRKLRVKALLLDLDGTLVDSSEALKEAGRAGFLSIGLARLNDKEMPFEVARRLEQDLPIDDLFTKFHVDKDFKEHFLPAYLSAYYSAVTVKSELFPNVEDTLRILSRNFLLALITLRYVAGEQVNDELEHLEIRKYFKVIVTALDVKKPKPFPDALLIASRKLGVPPSQCAIIGDSIVDVQAGKAAGAKTVAVLTGLFNYNELEKQRPNLIIKDLSSLPDFLEVGIKA